MRTRISLVSRVIAALCVWLAGSVVLASSAVASGPPVVAEEWTNAVVMSTANLDARINPAGLATTYRFEYGQTSAYEASVPAPGGSIAPGEEGEVSQQIVGLQPGTTYHYRVVATNAEGSVDGEDRIFTTFSTPAPAPADTCPNATYRVGFSALLPDCRAYEMVSPVVKNGGDVSGEKWGQTLASEDGGRAIFSSQIGFGEVSGSGNVGYTQYVAERGTNGWTSKGVTPRPNVGDGIQVFLGKTQLLEFSSDLSTAALLGDALEGVEDARPDSENLYLENTPTAKVTTAITDASNEGEPVPYPSFYLEYFGRPITEVIFNQPVLGGASASLNVATFQSDVNFTPEAHGGEYKAYVYEDGVVKLLGVLPDGTMPPGGSRLIHGPQYPGSLGGGDDENAIAKRDMVSTDGSRILFEVNELPGQIFMHRRGTHSVLVTESETSEPVTAENVRLEAATPDLRHIVFRTTTRLLDSAPEGEGIYMFTDSPNPESESNLTYIGKTEATGAFEEPPMVLGMSDDGTQIYYIEHFNHAASTLQLWDAGQTHQVAGWDGDPGEARVSSDGRELAFMNPNALTAAAQVRLERPGELKTSEMYVYKEDANTLTCVSCPATHAASIFGIETEVEANHSGTRLAEPYQPRFMTNDGRYVFFNTREALLPQDTNGVADAYEYNTETGRLSLLSTGTGEYGAWFVDATANGGEVFLVTRQKLTGWDPDKLVDLYTARVEGGLPEPPPPPAVCNGDACQGTPAAPPTFNTASGFTGLGNPSFAPIVKIKAKAKPNTRLRRALALCRRKRTKRRRAQCERLARKRYATRSSARNSRAGR